MKEKEDEFKSMFNRDFVLFHERFDGNYAEDGAVRLYCPKCNLSYPMGSGEEENGVVYFSKSDFLCSSCEG